MAGHDTYETVFSFENLYRAYKCCRRGVAWKASVQRYIASAPMHLARTHDQLMRGKYKSPGFYEFDIYERGKHRHIRSTTIGERVVQRCLCDNALVPAVQATFIHDNGATMKDKGYDFAVRRLKQHLHEHYRKYGQEGYILLYDFSKFFDNVSHKLLDGILRREFTDERIIRLTNHFIEMFGDVGLGLGSQISQVLALASANRLDHFIKEVLRIHCSGRYMDDGYLVHPSKAFLHRCLDAIRYICRELGIVLNEKKTQIVKLSHGFTWLKMRVFLTNTGKVITKICKTSVTRMRRKLRSMKRKMDAGRITYEDVRVLWDSWHGYTQHFACWQTVQNLGRLYNRLFVFNWREEYVY